ncbi:MAG: hypothetical protein ACQET7_09505 [Thermodesulfobacteriota bacterium]
MKVTNDEVIRSGEQELIDGITADLDWEAVETLFMEQHRLPLGEDVSYKKGDLVVHENRIAYLLEFEVKVPLSMILDREGNCVTIQAVPSSGPGKGKEQHPEYDETPSFEDGSHEAVEARAGLAGIDESTGT